VSSANNLIFPPGTELGNSFIYGRGEIKVVPGLILEGNW